MKFNIIWKTLFYAGLSFMNLNIMAVNELPEWNGWRFVCSEYETNKEMRVITNSYDSKTGRNINYARKREVKVSATRVLKKEGVEYTFSLHFSDEIQCRPYDRRRRGCFVPLTIDRYISLGYSVEASSNDLQEAKSTFSTSKVRIDNLVNSDTNFQFSGGFRFNRDESPARWGGGVLFSPINIIPGKSPVVSAFNREKMQVWQDKDLLKHVSEIETAFRDTCEVDYFDE